MTTRPLYVIARDIMRDPNYARASWCAGPYVSAMLSLSTVNDRYYDETARTVVAYALNNLKAWRGETARAIKSELRAMIK